jgi:hypothetical protein
MTGAGWCLHPDRIDIRSDLVLERASHLGCRRSWDEHSWEPIPDGDRAGDRFDRVRPIGPVPPASPAEIGSILEAERRAIHAAQQDTGLDVDRVVGTAPSPLRQVPRALQIRPIVTALENDTRDGTVPRETSGRRSCGRGRFSAHASTTESAQRSNPSRPRPRRRSLRR